MKRILVALTALTLIATGCEKKAPHSGEEEEDTPIVEPSVIDLSIIGAPESAVLVGEKFSLTVEITPDDVDVPTAEWSSSDPAVAKVNANGRVLATGPGTCDISASIGENSAIVTVSVNDRDPGKDAMGHEGASKTTQGKNNDKTHFSLGDTGLDGVIWYQGGNNSVMYYENGTFKAAWSGTNDFYAGVGYDYAEESGVNLENMQYDCYFKHSKAGSGGGYNYIGIHGWTVDPLVEFYIVDDWYNKPGAALLGQRKGEMTIDGDTYEIWQNTRVQQPSIIGTATFVQYYSVRKTARAYGHIQISKHFDKWNILGMKLGKLYEVRYYAEVGGGSGSLDCTYLFMSDGQI